jgi:anti-repressor protein
MKALSINHFNGLPVRVFEDENTEPWFVGKDISEILGYSSTSKMIVHVDEEDFIHANLEGMNMKSIIINEPGLYSAILGSEKPTAKPFKRWITKEVLPSIRKHGAYLTPERTDELINNPDLIIELATSLKAEREKTKQLEHANKMLQTKAELVDRIVDSDEMIDVGQAAKILSLPFGRNTLFTKLRNLGILFKDRNEPKQEYVERGYFVLKEKFIDRDNHEGFTVPKVLVTQKGLAYLHKIL